MKDKNESIEKIPTLSKEDKLSAVFFLGATIFLASAPMISSFFHVFAILVGIIGGICAILCFLLITKDHQQIFFKK